jgi:cysteine desulfurase
VGFPKNEKTEMLLMNLDMAGICVSGGSACTSGAAKGSHVIEAIYPEKEIIPVRFSFSKYNTKEEIDRVIQELKRHT